MAQIVSASQLVTAFQAALPVPVISHSTATPKYDLYEVYLFGLCVEAAESIGLTASFHHADGSEAKRLTLRTSPSSIWTQAQTFTHAALAADGAVCLEIHLGIFLRAGSGVSHEGDIVVMDAGEAARARALHTNPRVSKSAVVIEAKFHGSNVRLRTGREFLGLVADVGGRPPIFVSSSPSNSVQKLLSYRGRAGHFDLTPGSNQEIELKSQVAVKLRDHLARR